MKIKRMHEDMSPGSLLFKSSLKALPKVLLGSALFAFAPSAMTRDTAGLLWGEASSFWKSLSTPSQVTERFSAELLT